VSRAAAGSGASARGTGAQARWPSKSVGTSHRETKGLALRAVSPNER
jgi:hypothetical protein